MLAPLMTPAVAARLASWPVPCSKAQMLGRIVAMDAAAAMLFAALPVRALHAAVRWDNGASRALLEHLGARLVGPGRIWCPSRRRDEPCLYYALPRG